MNFTLVFFVVLLFCGLVVDVGGAEWQARNVQIAADAAAKGATLEKERGASDRVAAGRTDAATNGSAVKLEGIMCFPTTGVIVTGNTVQSVVLQNLAGVPSSVVTVTTSWISNNNPGSTVKVVVSANFASSEVGHARHHQRQQH